MEQGEVVIVPRISKGTSQFLKPIMDAWLLIPNLETNRKYHYEVHTFLLKYSVLLPDIYSFNIAMGEESVSKILK